MWNETQDFIADKNGVAIVVVDENSSVVHKSNNNSMCRILYPSEEFAPECDKFCGKAFEMASKAETPVNYQCYAGLDCCAVPIKKGDKTQFVAIVGRAFTKTGNYRKATERVIAGDWKQFSPNEFFENVLIKGSTKDLETASESIENLTDEEKSALTQFADKNQAKVSEDDVLDIPKENKIPSQEVKKKLRAGELIKLVEQVDYTPTQMATVSEKITRKNGEETEEFAAWRSLFSSLLKMGYQQACLEILKFVSKHYSLDSVAWLERKENRLETVFADGKLKNQLLNISVAADDERVRDAVGQEISLELRQRKNKESDKSQTIRLFPIAVGGEIQCGLFVHDEAVSQSTRRHISRFCQSIALELEILRLREELARRDLLELTLQKFNANLSEIDTINFWSRLTQISAEIV
ncbi:MAG: PocR ligand-binding domain-containing protein [Acidobacteriota bacterium]|nr:PocR ligand-binding domain-containing protein [Acidobacteriota bacterium]